jgi:O-antigen/teichoic acid export membrane protein
VAIAVNITLCVILTPHLGAIGAAIATAAALMVETASLFIIAKHRLGFQVFIWSRADKR